MLIDLGPWAEQAICKKLDLDTAMRLFYPKGNGRDYKDDIEASKRVCAQCPVRSECLEHAVSNVEDNGTWGGLTEWELRSVRTNGGSSARKINGHHTNKIDAMNCTQGRKGKRCTACETFLRSTCGKSYSRTCEGCGIEFATNRSDQRFHDATCSRRNCRKLKMEQKSA
jgi:WhiB family redox-sensing transcriptional regulator